MQDEKEISANFCADDDLRFDLGRYFLFGYSLVQFVVLLEPSRAIHRKGPLALIFQKFLKIILLFATIDA